MGMQVLRDGAGSGIIKYILMSFLLLAMGGLVFTDVGGFFRDGVGTNDVAKVGGEGISIVEFDNTLRRQLSQSKITPQIAYQIGYTDRILEQEIQGYLMKQAAADAGIKISREKFTAYIMEMMTQMGVPGEKPSATLARTLQQWGLSEQRFLKIIERSLAEQYLRGAITSGFATTSDNIAKDFYAYQNEKRDIQLVLYPHDKFKDYEQPTEERITRYYEVAKNEYTIPESRNIAVITIKEDKIKTEIAEDILRAAYDENIDAYTIPAKKKIIQAIFETEEAAKSVQESTKTNLSKAAKSKAINVTDEENLAEDQIISGLGAKIFGHEGNGIIGPFKTALGWYLVEIKGSSPEKVQSFDSVKADIQKQLKEDERAEQLALIADQVDDALANGASPEQVAQDVDIEIARYDALTMQSFDTLKPLGDDANDILKSTFELFEGESSPVFEGKNGKYMAVSLLGITPQSYKPLEDVKQDIYKTLRTQNQQAANKAAAEKLAEPLEAQDNADLNAFAKAQNHYLQNIKKISRSGEQKDPITPAAVTKIFDAQIGETMVLDVKDGVAIVKITKSHLPSAEKISKEDLETQQTQAIQSAQNEALTIFINKEQQKRGVRINKQRLKTAYAPREGEGY